MKLFFSVILFFSGAASSQSLSSFLSEKLQTMSQGECPSVHYKDVLNSQTCYRYNPPLEGAEDDLFFHNLIDRKLPNLECQLDRIGELKAEKKQEETVQIAQNLKSRIVILRKLNDELQAQKRKLIAESGRGNSSRSKERDQARKNIEKLELAIEQVRSSVWMADSPAIQEFLDSALELGSQYEKHFNQFFLDPEKGDFHFLLQKLEKEVQKDIQDLKPYHPSSQRKLPAKVPDSLKVELFKDSKLVSSVSNSMSPSVWPGLYCRMNARYGEGREKLKTAATTAVAAASLATPIGFGAAAAAGLITVSAARVLTLASLTGIGANEIAKTYEEKCKSEAGQKLPDYEMCSSVPNNNQMISIRNSNCALEVALSTLELPLTEIKPMMAGLTLFGVVLDEGREFKILQNGLKKQTERSVYMGHYGPQNADFGLFLKTDLGDEKVKGYFEYSLSGRGSSELYLDIVNVDSKYRGRGFSDALFQQVFKENPQVTKVKASLATTNEQVYDKALQRGLSQQEAIRETPLYKSLNKQGFSEVKIETKTYKNSRGVSFTMDEFEFTKP